MYSVIAEVSKDKTKLARQFNYARLCVFDGVCSIPIIIYHFELQHTIRCTYVYIVGFGVVKKTECVEIEITELLERGCQR